MASYKPSDSYNTFLNLMNRRLGIFYRQELTDSDEIDEEVAEKGYKGKLNSILDPGLVGVDNQRTLLNINGGHIQQDRMIFDKRRTLDRAIAYSYQGAIIKKISAESTDDNELGVSTDTVVPALINPNKNKVDYDDKILSVGYEYSLRTGDVFEWVGTGTYWLIYLQDLTELAYFRGDIRRCSYQISWDDGNKSTYAAIRGPVETKIDSSQKHQIYLDNPNHSLHILMPKNKDTLSYFQRYTKFYLQDETPTPQNICWRVEATDWISTPGILEVTAVEYYSNTTEDDVANGLVGTLKTKVLNPNSDEIEGAIDGYAIIKPKIAYTYTFTGTSKVSNPQWTLDKKYPVTMTVDDSDKKKVTIKWNSTYRGQMQLSYGGYTKTIIIQSLF